VVDHLGQPVPPGIPGELHIGGQGVARGYLQRPGLTAEKFVPDPFSGQPGARLYRTGDLVRHRGDGELEFLGRIDQQVKLRGYRIELGEIEAALMEQAAVREAVVITQESGGEKRLVGYVVSEGEVKVDELRQALRVKLPEYMVPSALVVLESLPLTPNGKLDRRALPAPNGTVSTEREYLAPRTTVEKVLAKIYGKVLGLAQVSIDDNFFDLGGHSLLATKLISRVRESFCVEIPLRVVFEAPTVIKMAAAIEKISAGDVIVQPSRILAMPRASRRL
jgi:acyl carrier protein